VDSAKQEGVSQQSKVADCDSANDQLPVFTHDGHRKVEKINLSAEYEVGQW
jgi:hypothetical protein